MLLSFHCFLLLIFIRLDTAMKSKTFDSIVTFLRDSNITKFEALQQRFPDLDVNSLRSIFCQQIERRSISFNCAAIEKPETHWEWFTKVHRITSVFIRCWLLFTTLTEVEVDILVNYVKTISWLGCPHFRRFRYNYFYRWKMVTLMTVLLVSLSAVQMHWAWCR